MEQVEVVELVLQEDLLQHQQQEQVETVHQ
jgi:hypothetical protein